MGTLQSRGRFVGVTPGTRWKATERLATPGAVCAVTYIELERLYGIWSWSFGVWQ